MKTTTLHQTIQALAAALILLAFALVAVPAIAADDPSADAKIQEARAALNAEKYRQAALLYAEARAAARSRELAAHALYWEAFARYRLDKTQELKVALELLQLQAREYGDVTAEAQAEAEALAARISGELAARGEPEAAREIYEMAEAERQREDTRVAALHALMQMDPDKAVPILAKIIRGETAASRELRHNAVFILCRVDERGAEIVRSALPETDEPEVLEAMVMCLAESGNEADLDALVELLRRTEDPQLAQAILIALGHAQDERSFDILADIARDPARDPEMRAHALVGLSQIEDERTIDIALEIIGESAADEQVLEMALMILANSENPRAASALLTLAENPDADEDMRAMALYQAGMQGAVEVGRLQEIYRNSESRDLKVQICHVLAQLETEEAFEAMLEIVRNEEDPEVRQNAVFWLGQFDDPRAAEVLLEIIEGK